jgi:L-amino acid N-acyltransferase
MPTTIRLATPTDLPAILAIYNDAVLHTTASYDYEPATLEARIAWFEARNAQGLPILVATNDDLVVGWSSFGPFRPWAGYRYSVEHSIYVAAERRGQGIGRLLLAPLIDKARGLGMHTMLAGIDADNQASLRLHAAFGFVQVAHFRQVGHKFGRWLDLIFLQLLLD